MSFQDYVDAELQVGEMQLVDFSNVLAGATVRDSMKLLILHVRTVNAEFVSVVKNNNADAIVEENAVNRLCDIVEEWWCPDRYSIGPLSRWEKWTDYSKPLYKVLTKCIKESVTLHKIHCELVTELVISEDVESDSDTVLSESDSESDSESVSDQNPIDCPPSPIPYYMHEDVFDPKQIVFGNADDPTPKSGTVWRTKYSLCC